MWPNPQKIGDFIKFTEEILNGNFIFLCIGVWMKLKLDLCVCWSQNRTVCLVIIYTRTGLIINVVHWRKLQYESEHDMKYIKTGDASFKKKNRLYCFPWFLIFVQVSRSKITFLYLNLSFHIRASIYLIDPIKYGCASCMMMLPLPIWWHVYPDSQS